MAIRLQDVRDLETLLRYCSVKLNWPLEADWFEDIDDLVYDFSAVDLGIKEIEFSMIRSIKQLRPLVDNQPWGIFAVDLMGEHLKPLALRRIVHGLIPHRKTTEFKTWSYDKLLFLCFWGSSEFRTVGFVAFEDSGHSLPILKTLYCTPRLEDRTHLENFESRIAVLAWPDMSDSENWIRNWSRFFAPARGQIISDTLVLTSALANTALSISQALISSFEIETIEGFTHQLYHRFNNALKIDLSQHDFIDMYSQTIVYGLFSARCMHPEVTPFTIESAINCIPETNPLLRDLLLEYCTPGGLMQFDEFDICDLVDALNRTDIDHILIDFNRQTGYGKEDPIIYFYERFLDQYEHEEKKRKGVYYTPIPAVDFIVRSISYLLEEKFNCTAGFLDSSVSILDPATGTGTFLRSIILNAFDEYKKLQNRGNWSEFVAENLLKRLFGFEFMMAPYAVAHMKLAMTLKDTGYVFQPNHRLQVYLANSLECGDFQGFFGDTDDPLLKESNCATLVRDSRINVVLGNPPYRTDSVNKGKWIMQLMEDYKREPGTADRLRERNPKVINDDYVKFMRVAQDIVANEDNAIISFVVPHSFAENLTFRGMRWKLLHTFDYIYIFDLHGNVMSRESSGSEERDENIFDIQQGVCICFLIKEGKKRERNALVFYTDLLGSRERKYQFLSTVEFPDLIWKKVEPFEPYYFFKPKNLEGAVSYETGILLSKLFPIFLGGIKTHHDGELISKTPFNTGFDQLYDYRPFDIRHINYDRSKVERDRYDIMKHIIGHDNLGLVFDRQAVTDNWSHIQVVKHMIDNRLHYSHKGIPVICPMYLYDENGKATPNIDHKEFQKLCITLNGETPEILEVFDYCYGVLYSSTYRAKYSELLSIDFPRVPIPADSNMFHEVTEIGRHLRKIHLLELPIENQLFIEFCGTGDNVVSHFHYNNERVYINRTQYFSNVREDIWDFCFAGYHGMQKWFKDRSGELLSPADVQHIIDVFNVFDLTETDMTKVDSILGEYEII